MEDGGWRMEDGGWRMEDGGWRMENDEGRTTGVEANPSRSNIISDLLGRLIYYPTPGQASDDSFEYAVVVCPPYGRTSSSSEVTVTVKPVRDTPVALSFEVNTTENDPVHFSLRSADVDTQGVVYIVTLLPVGGILYQADFDDSSTVAQEYVAEKGEEGVRRKGRERERKGEGGARRTWRREEKKRLTGGGRRERNSKIVRIQEGKGFFGGRVVYVPNPDSCSENYDFFKFAVTDGTSGSNDTLVFINVFCGPGRHLYSTATQVVISTLTGLAILICIGVAIWIIFMRRKLRGEKSVFLVLMLLGFMISLSYNFFMLTPMTDALCGFHTWWTSFGTMIVAA
jgi:hypothetical protein